MNIDQIIDTIYELEDAPTTFQNCINLAALYICRDALLKSNLDEIIKQEHLIEGELFDILPSYKSYINVKREYQFGNTIEESVTNAMMNLCSEIGEFISILYSNTESEIDRGLIRELLSNLSKKYS